MSLRDVIGQGGAVKMLGGALARGRVAGSYLFAGEQGIGKRFCAFAFAKALCCRQPQTAGGLRDACGQCPSCHKLDAGTHADFLLIEPESGTIKVDHIRRLEGTLALRSFEGGARVVVVDDAEAMNPSAANAFLKTLEEPPAGSHVILVSAAPDRLPDTIRSRCVRVAFHPLSEADCRRVIGRKAKGKDELVRLAMGRPGLAVREDLVRQRDRFLTSLEKLRREDTKHPWRDRQAMERWLDQALIVLRDMAVLRITKRPGALINRDASARVGNLAGNSELDIFLSAYTVFHKLRNSTGFNLNRPVTWNYIASIVESW